jgi:hypothetical protein
MLPSTSAAITASSVPGHDRTIYPPPFAARVAGRVGVHKDGTPY